MTYLRLECVCRRCKNVECYLTVVIDAESGKDYRPPNNCISRFGEKSDWMVERISIEEADER